MEIEINPVWDYEANKKAYIIILKFDRYEMELTKNRYCSERGAKTAARRIVRKIYESARDSKGKEDFIRTDRKVSKRDKRK